MDTETLAGRLLVAALPGPELRPADLAALADLRPAGIILFARNLRSPAQAAELLQGVRETVGRPVLTAVDQEGGRVNRLAEIDPVFRELPDGRTQARWEPEDLDEAWFRVGRVLAALGFNVDFAPVTDLDAGDGANAIGARSFGTDPGFVAERAGIVLDALGRAGVAGCIKHFPGLGGTDLDTHLALAVSPLSVAELRDAHAVPYGALRERAPLVMTAHAAYPSVDPVPEGGTPLPATFSPRLLHGWLREELGYDGVVISDDLEMGAVAGLGSPGERALRALSAGADLALFCHDLDVPRLARDEMAAALRSGRLEDTVVRASARRLAVLFARLVTEQPVPRYDEAIAALAEALRRAARRA